MPLSRQGLERAIYHGLREFYQKQGIEVSEELDFALAAQAEFLAAILLASKQQGV